VVWLKAHADADAVVTVVAAANAITADLTREKPDMIIPPCARSAVRKIPERRGEGQGGLA
jgi:hypothetical protein